MAAVETASPMMGTAAACDALGVPRASVYRRRQPARPRAARPAPPRALDARERQTVLDTLHSERFIDQAPAQVHATLLDEGTYLCAPRTMYRLLDTAGEVKERRDQVRRPHYAAPELLATRPNEVWSWDITNRPRPEGVGLGRPLRRGRSRRTSLFDVQVPLPGVELFLLPNVLADPTFIQTDRADAIAGRPKVQSRHPPF